MAPWALRPPGGNIGGRFQWSAPSRPDPNSGKALPVQLPLDAARLRQILAAAAPGKPCRCGLGACAGWESLSEDRWPAKAMQAVGTLRDAALAEPTYEEWHPDGTRYESPDAPVAVSFFPYNRCDLWRCGQCERHVLRYTEFGGYYVDHRVRALLPATPVID